MKSAASILGTPRRMFLAVVVLLVLVLVLAWELSDGWRTGIHEHRVSYNSSNPIRSVIPVRSANDTRLQLGTRFLCWSYEREGAGALRDGDFSSAVDQWQFAPCARTNLLEVTPEDGRGAFSNVAITIRDRQILLVRPTKEPQTVYALEAVEQSYGDGYFRSRKILPSPR